MIGDKIFIFLSRMNIKHKNKKPSISIFSLNSDLILAYMLILWKFCSENPWLFIESWTEHILVLTLRFGKLLCKVMSHEKRKCTKENVEHISVFYQGLTGCDKSEGMCSPCSPIPALSDSAVWSSFPCRISPFIPPFLSLPSLCSRVKWGGNFRFVFVKQKLLYSKTLLDYKVNATWCLKYPSVKVCTYIRSSEM